MGYLSQFLTDVFLCLSLAPPEFQEMLPFVPQANKVLMALSMSQYCSQAGFPHV